ncbi:MAG TPA: SMI1/KNR4 family protein [Microlunatus sp.]|nr:SMI1/KNR4 family protein [Microlunatus sp.]
MPAAREEQIAVVEALIGLRFPAEHRRLLLEQDGWSTTYGDTHIQFLGVEQIRSQCQVVLHDGPRGLVDFVPFAGDGSRGLIGYDRRVDPSPVVMLDSTATDWSSAMLQGVTFGDFIDRLQSSKALDFSTGYADPTA